MIATVFITTASAVYGAPPNVLVLVFFAILTGQYSIDISNNYFDRILDKKSGRKDKAIANGDIPAGASIRIAVVLLVISIVLSLLLPSYAGFIHIIALIIAWIYNLKLKRTPFSILCYMGAFSIIPLFIAMLTDNNTTIYVMATFAFAGSSAHFVEALKDYDYDKKVSIRPFPSIFDLQLSKKLQLLSTTLFFVLLAISIVDSL